MAGALRIKAGDTRGSQKATRLSRGPIRELKASVVSVRVVAAVLQPSLVVP